jgi:hypothetical protein
MLGKGEWAREGEGGGGRGGGGRREASLSLCLQITAVPHPLMYPDIMSTLPFNVCTYSTVPTVLRNAFFSYPSFFSPTFCNGRCSLKIYLVFTVLIVQTARSKPSPSVS